MNRVLFKDRASAGHMLAREAVSRHFERPVVYALPRGGVPVAVPVAAALDAPLDLLLVRKIGVPRQPELAAASIVDGERRDIIVNERVARAAGLSKADLDLLAKDQWSEIERRRTMYLRNRSAIPANGRTAILVDDGIATGASMLAAIAAIRRRNPLATVVAIPVASRDAIEHLAPALGNWPARFRDALSRQETERARQMALDMQGILEIVGAVPCAAALGRMADVLAQQDKSSGSYAAALGDLDGYLLPLLAALQQAAEKIRAGRALSSKEQGHNSAS